MNKKFFIRVIFILVFCCLGIYILLNFKSKFIIKNGVLVRYKEGIFAKLTNPKQITIPDEVTRIGECAFRRCFEVETITITIPDSVEVIELAAFSYCENLKEVYLPSKLRYIPMFCFGECRKLEKAYMQDNIKMIDIFAFTECTSLEYIDFPSSIIIINEFVFSYTGLKSVKLPEN